MERFNKQNSEILTDRKQFLFLFISLLFLFQFIAYWLSNSVYMQSLIAAKVGDTSSLFNNPILVQGNQLIDEGTKRFLIVDQKCTGFALIATLSALLLSLPNTLFRKLLSVIVVIVLLQLENLIRINHLHHILVTKEASFHYYHLYVWQGINFVYAIIVFFTMYYMFYSNSRYRKGHSEVS